MIDSTNILLNAGMTQQQIIAGRMANIAERMQRDIQLAALLVEKGAKAWQQLYPEAPPEKLAEWAQTMLRLASQQLTGDGEQETAVPAYPEPYDVLIPNQQAYVESRKSDGERRREQKKLDELIAEASKETITKGKA